MTCSNNTCHTLYNFQRKKNKEELKMKNIQNVLKKFQRGISTIGLQH